MPFLLYGKYVNGDLLHISEAKRGELCNCSCPFCDQALLAKKGNVKVHHFAHKEKTCQFVSAYDFLHVESPFFDTGKDLLAWSEWKKQNMDAYQKELRNELAATNRMWEHNFFALNNAIAILSAESQIAPGRKVRSKVRQANHEVLLELHAYLSDHNAPFPGFENVRYTENRGSYRNMYMEERFGKSRLYCSGGIGAGSLWQQPKHLAFVPDYLSNSIEFLYNDYPKLRRTKVNLEQKLQAFEIEKERFALFRLYFLHITLPGAEPLFKIGITSRKDIADRIGEIRQDLRVLKNDNIEIEVLYQVEGYAFLEAYFKKKYASYSRTIGKLTEYFSFPEQTLEEILSQLRRLYYKSEGWKLLTKERMEKAAKEGKQVFHEKETKEKFLSKPRSRHIAELLQEGLSMRKIEALHGYSMNTIRKVSKLLGHDTTAANKS